MRVLKNDYIFKKRTRKDDFYFIYKSCSCHPGHSLCKYCDKYEYCEYTGTRIYTYRGDGCLYYICDLFNILDILIG